MNQQLVTPPTIVQRIVYLGTPEVAVAPLRALHSAGFDIVLVISAADRRRGRGSKLSPSPVKAAALELGLAVSDTVDDVLDVHSDLGVVVAFGQLIRPNVLAHVPMVNLHFSLLPRWRGAAPVERALLAGDDRTGVCLMALEEGLDTGGIYRSVEVPIGPEATLDSLRHELVELGSELLVEALLQGLGPATKQEGDPLYAKKIQPDEYRIDWTGSTSSVDRQIRLGRAWTLFRGKRLRIWQATVNEGDAATVAAAGVIEGLAVGTGDGSLSLEIVQPEGRARMAATDWRNGAQPTPEDVLT